MSQPHSAILNIIQSLINGRSVWPLRRLAKKRIPGILSKKEARLWDFFEWGVFSGERITRKHFLHSLLWLSGYLS